MSATEEFVALVRQPEPAVPLDQACLLIAAHAAGGGQARTVVEGGLRRLDELAAGCPEATVGGLYRHLFVTEGFRGNRADYDDEHNSYLDWVLAHRTGIPITLAVVAIEVGRRLGVPLTPVGMPGHFMVGVGEGYYLDAFDGGRMLDEAGCRERFLELAGPDAPWSPAFLEPVSVITVLARVLANLRRRFIETRDLGGLDWVLALRVALPGIPVSERAERSSVLAALGRYDEAARELEHLADAQDLHGGAMSAHPSGGPEAGGTAAAGAADELRHQAARLRARLN